jgi:DNA-binding MarR family transcriptional regulator
MSTTPMFDARLLGQTEKAANAILDRLLSGTGVTEPQWVALSLLATSGEPLDRRGLVARVAGALKRAEADAGAHVSELAEARLIDTAGEPDSPVALTDEGLELYARVRGEVVEITRRLWGDLPSEDLATAGRVLSTVLERAESELLRIG